MSFFSSRHSSNRFGVIIDVGSGSVLSAIVHSAPAMKKPEIVWSHRDHAPLRNIDSLEQSSKAVMTALMNVAMLLDTEGRKALHEYDSKARLTELQCGISAPWSYTVTKTVNYHQDESFCITSELIEDLEQTVEKQIKLDLEETKRSTELGLTVISHMTTGLTANGYQVVSPEGEYAKDVSISQTSAVSQEYLIDAISDLKNKVLVEAEVVNNSFILILFCVINEFFYVIKDSCLIDITYEATEIGLVREGVLTYATHTPFGSFSLAREISAVSGIPLHEAFAHLHSEIPYKFKDSLTKEQQKEVDAIFDAYTDRLANLFKQTGDDLSIPKQICLHSDRKSEKLYADLIDNAARRIIKNKPAIIFVTTELEKLFQNEENSKKNQISFDSALMLSAQFFHTRTKHKNLEYL